MFRIGIIGLGKIARMMATTINSIEDVILYAVGSRSIDKAIAFQKNFGAKKAYGSYDELMEDPNVDLIYIATPHSHHAELMEKCINHNKPVLCEKAFTINKKEAEKVYKLAAEKKVFVAEAIWTRYQPMRQKIEKVIGSGIIGEPYLLTANLAYDIENIERIHNPHLAGGALLDLGVYTLNFAIMIFGNKIKRISSLASISEDEVDEQETIDLIYQDGKIASLFCSAKFNSDRRGIIYGKKGYIQIENINNPESITVYNQQNEIIKQVERKKQITGYEYEVLACKKAIEAKKLEPEEMTWKETLEIMSIMDSLRQDWNLKYPME